MIQLMTIHQLEEVADIIRSQLGDDCVFEELSCDKDVRTTVFLEENLIIAVCVVEILRSSDFLKAVFPCGFIRNIAVKEEFCGRGIATKLIADGLNWLTCRVDYVYATAWISQKGINIKIPLERNGFFQVEKLDNFYESCSDCPDCRPKLCNCSAVLFGLSFHQ